MKDCGPKGECNTNDIPGLFGSLVFNDAVMRERLPQDIYTALKKTIINGTHLELDVANMVASAMKEWALEKGVTHYTHWFHPMTGITAEKHDSFISPVGDGKIVMEFSGTELVRGEPDASSFPSGGLRTTFEARGYTAWDPTSYAFIKDGTLCIPTAFCSYGGDALDKKTPLLRSMDAIDREAKRILKLFGDGDVKRVVTNVGPEQEYFLIDKEVWKRRPDLVYCGRTLLGARPPKGQEMEDHYFGAIKPRVSAFMRDLEEELWKVGVTAKTKHNEAAPAQHELAPVFDTVNIAMDHNQVTMELMKIMAGRHGLVCLLHEKPFAGINGSGKHNNWSISTSTGVNLLEPGDTPSQNARFLLFLAAVIKGVDEYQDLLRLSVASAGNDHRLGAGEAPPAILSIFLGDELTEILEDLEHGEHHEDKQKSEMEIGVTALPHFPKDVTDRNRTSPFAFTGNKFEFRMLGSALSIAGPNFVLNTIVAEALSQFADILEPSKNFKEDLDALVRRTMKAHKRIIFNGNNYSEQWIKEAERRGLSNLKSTVDALPIFIEERNIRLFGKHHVLSASEIRSRYEILLENYVKTLHIEGLAMVDMVRKEIMPAVITYRNEIASTARHIMDMEGDISVSLEKKLLEKSAKLASGMYKKLEELEQSLCAAKDIVGPLEQARFYRETVFLNMSHLRSVVDELEPQVGKKYWPYPTYGEILHSVN